VNAKNQTVVVEPKPKRKYTRRKPQRNAKPSQRTRIITMLQTGLTPKQVQAMVGCALQTVYDVKYRYNQAHKDAPIVMNRSKTAKATVLAQPPAPVVRTKPPTPVPVQLTWRQRFTALFTGRV
jgi:hypothetical protein